MLSVDILYLLQYLINIQVLHAPLDGDRPAAARVRPAVRVRALARPEDGALLLHLVGVVVLLEAVDAEVEVLAHGAVVAVLDVLLAGVAGVDELVGVGRVQLVQESLGGKFSTSQTGEF